MFPVSLSLVSLAGIYSANAASIIVRDDTLDFRPIISTLNAVPAFSIPADATPNQPPIDTVITALNGDLTGNTPSISTTNVVRRDPGEIEARGSSSSFKQVFAGNPDGQTDCAIEGTGYLTYTVVSNATYSVDACLDYCASIKGCVFANLYYEYNNALLDWVFTEKSNLKCAVYSDIHTAKEKTNCGGQQLEPEPHAKNYMTKSSGYALKSLPDMATPKNYWKIFGPINFAIKASGHLGFALLSQYDVGACASQCDSTKGCHYFNIWRAVKDDAPKSYVCSMYSLQRSLTSASKASYSGQDGVSVTWSRGYFKFTGLQSLLGGFWKLLLG